MHFYVCLLSCELKSTYENSLEEIIDHREVKSLPSNLDGQKREIRLYSITILAL